MNVDRQPQGGRFVPPLGTAAFALRLIAGFAVLAMIVGALFLVRARGMGAVRVRTRPAGATVTFDDMQTTSGFPDDFGGAGATWSPPLILHRHPGTYDVSVTVPGYAVREACVVVQAGQTAALDVDLETTIALDRAEAGRPSGPLHADGMHLDIHWPTHEPEGRARPRPMVLPAEPVPARAVPARPVLPMRPPIPVRPLIPVRPPILLP
jgi:hypothetical protein